MVGMNLLNNGDFRKEGIYPEGLEPLEVHAKLFADKADIDTITWVEKHCYIDRVSQVIIFPAVYTHIDQLPSVYPSYEALLHGLRDHVEGDLTQYHLVGGIVGMGNTERHIATLYRAPDGTTTIFDSKNSDSQTFLQSSDKPSFSWETVSRAVKGFFRSVFQWGRGENIESTIEGGEKKPLRYEHLSTQSFFDRVGCGYQTLGLIHSIYGLITANRHINRETVLDALDKQNPVVTALNKLDILHGHKPRTRKSFISLLQETWKDTFQSSYGKKGIRYIFDWPSPKESKLLYFFTLGWLRSPLKALVKTLVEWPVNLVNVLFNWTRHRFMAWAPVSWYGKLIRSSLLLLSHLVYGVGKLIGVLLGKIFSPFAKEGAKVDELPADMEDHSARVDAFDDEEEVVPSFGEHNDLDGDLSRGSTAKVLSSAEDFVPDEAHRKAPQPRVYGSPIGGSPRDKLASTDWLDPTVLSTSPY